MRKLISSRNHWAGLAALALMLVACDDATRNERLISQFSASISGAITDQFEATPDTVSNAHIYVIERATPGLITIIARRREAAGADFVSFTIRDVGSVRRVQSEGALVLIGDTSRVFALKLDVEVVRLTSSRLTGVFTGLGAGSLTPDAPPDTIFFGDGQFDIALEEPISLGATVSITK